MTAPGLETRSSSHIRHRFQARIVDTLAQMNWYRKQEPPKVRLLLIPVHSCDTRPAKTNCFCNTTDDM